MKLHRDESEPVIELSEHDLAHPERVVPLVTEGCYVYAPAADSTPDIEPRALTVPPQWYDDPPPPTKPQRLDNPARLDALRVALASHGLELRHVGAFYSRVESARAESKRCAS